MKKKDVLMSREALVEMYKAGFLDGYRVFKKGRSKAFFEELNEKYKKSFIKRFEKPINKELKNAPVPIRKRKV
jgi:hypothetical protein